MATFNLSPRPIKQIGGMKFSMRKKNSTKLKARNPVKNDDRHQTIMNMLTKTEKPMVLFIVIMVSFE